MGHETWLPDMTKDELLQLFKQFSHDNCFLSYHNYKDPSYLKLVDAGPDILPMVLERLQDSIGHDSGDAFDHDNSPWLSVMLCGELSKGECTKEFPREHAGRLDKLRTHILQWGRSKGLIK